MTRPLSPPSPVAPTPPTGTAPAAGPTPTEEERYREPFAGRFWGFFNVEGDEEPAILFHAEGIARADLARRQALPDDQDDWLSDDWCVLPCDVAGTVWNCFDPDPRADNPLTPQEILAVHEAP